MRDFIINLLITSAVMSLITMVFYTLSPLAEKRYTAKTRYYAWLIIIVGFAVPFRPQFDSAFFTVELPVENVEVSQNTENEKMLFSYEEVQPFTQILPSETMVADEQPALHSHKFTFWETAFGLWVFGVIMFLVIFTAKNIRFFNAVKRWSSEIKDERIIKIFNEIKTEIGVSGKINLLHCESIYSPMATGFFKPFILLSSIDYSDIELRFIFKHELTHRKRKDLWIKSLSVAAIAINWFNPVIYFTAKQLNSLCEISCDGEVVKDLNTETRSLYGEMVLTASAQKNKTTKATFINTVLTTNFYGGKKDMKKRIFSIMENGKKKAGTVIICAAILVTAGSGFIISAGAVNPKIPIKSISQTAGDEKPKKIYNPAVPSISSLPDIIGINSIEFSHNKQTDYAEFGLTTENGEYYFNSQLVRYFEDKYKLEDLELISSSFNCNGVVDVYTVRDEKGTLTGIKEYSKEEFDSRNIDEYSNSTFSIKSDSVMPGFGISSDFAMPSFGGNVPFSKIFSDGTFDFSDLPKPEIFNFNGRDVFDMFSDYESFGLTRGEIGQFFYDGKVVRAFSDPVKGIEISLFTAENDYDKAIDLTAVYDDNNNLTGLKAASKEEFDERTAKLDELMKSREQMFKNRGGMEFGGRAGGSLGDLITHRFGISSDGAEFEGTSL